MNISKIKTTKCAKPLLCCHPPNTFPSSTSKNFMQFTVSFSAGSFKAPCLTVRIFLHVVWNMC